MSHSPQTDDRCRSPGRALAFLSAMMLTAGCHAVHLLPRDRVEPRKDDQAVQAAPARYSFRIAANVFLNADFEVQRDLPLFQDLAKLPDQVSGELRLPSGNALVQVYLFQDRERYERFMQSRYPDLPRRRAFFVAQPRSLGGAEDLLVYTFWGERIQQDLRHELTHALLHGVIRDVPLWLDEGLAEYFELPAERQGLNAAHVELLRRAGPGDVKPDLARLEGLSQVSQMTPAEYREAWAWVHLLLRSRPEVKAVLLDYLQQLRTNRNPGQLGPRLARVFPSPEEALEKHLKELEAGKPTVVPASRR